MTATAKLSMAALILVILGWLAGGATAQEKKMSAHDIMKKTWWTTKLDGAEMLSTITLYNPKGQARVRRTAGISKLYDNGKTEKRLIRFLAPADVKGTGLLTYDYEEKDDDIWFFLPSLRKTRRIVASEKSKSFMGSEFSYSDVTPPPVDDYAYKLLKTEQFGGVTCWVIESVPKTDKIAEENGHSKKIVWVGQPDFAMRKTVYYDLDKRLLKTLVAEDIREIDPTKHRYRAMQMTMENHQNKRKSVLKTQKIKLRKAIPDKYFTTRFLERI